MSDETKALLLTSIMWIALLALAAWIVVVVIATIAKPIFEYFDRKKEEENQGQ